MEAVLHSGCARTSLGREGGLQSLLRVRVSAHTGAALKLHHSAAADIVDLTAKMNKDGNAQLGRAGRALDHPATGLLADGCEESSGRARRSWLRS